MDGAGVGADILNAFEQSVPGAEGCGGIRTLTGDDVRVGLLGGCSALDWSPVENRQLDRCVRNAGSVEDRRQHLVIHRDLQAVLDTGGGA